MRGSCLRAHRRRRRVLRLHRNNSPAWQCVARTAPPACAAAATPRTTERAASSRATRRFQPVDRRALKRRRWRRGSRRWWWSAILTVAARFKRRRPRRRQRNRLRRLRRGRVLDRMPRPRRAFDRTRATGGLHRGGVLQQPLRRPASLRRARELAHRDRGRRPSAAPAPPRSRLWQRRPPLSIAQHAGRTLGSSPATTRLGFGRPKWILSPRDADDMPDCP